MTKDDLCFMNQHVTSFAREKKAKNGTASILGEIREQLHDLWDGATMKTMETTNHHDDCNHGCSCDSYYGHVHDDDDHKTLLMNDLCKTLSELAQWEIDKVNQNPISCDDDDDDSSMAKRIVRLSKTMMEFIDETEPKAETMKLKAA